MLAQRNGCTEKDTVYQIHISCHVILCFKNLMLTITSMVKMIFLRHKYYVLLFSP